MHRTLMYTCSKAHLQKLVKALSEALRVSSHVQPSGLALHPSLQGFQLLNGLVAHLSCKTILLLHNQTGSLLNLDTYSKEGMGNMHALKEGGPKDFGE